MLRMIALRTATMGRIGLMEASLSGLARGSMEGVGSTGMWTTGLTLGMATMDRCRDAGRSSSTTSRAMRLAMGMGTWVMRAMMLGANMRCRDSMAVADILAVDDRDSR
jgi:hypothetical protein